LPDVGKTPAPKAIPDHKVPQGHKALKGFRECPARRDKLGLKVRKGHKALPAKKGRGARKERRATRAIPVRVIRETKGTGAKRVKKAMQVQQSALSKSMDR
jgi:hypothetical protein